MEEQQNTTQRLVNEFGMDVLEIALATGAASRTVERWLKGTKPVGGYRILLDDLVTMQTKKKGAQK